ncbi:hypothetical protein [Cerasicoccus arenae]|uniref:Chromosome partition protein Smc n=1 Tax=Cerasicoccus arenae TaxID=424488 RepID=A0A8J3D8K3_9BACT|nr:hypothetical protein [Cerasicoccus arenae]MBK1857530.1 hypothetical protein [Cerasicoccus arenae]GHB95546.1 hypothetical protein GCM10007047_09190 [Cerasicoccus arenae]
MKGLSIALRVIAILGAAAAALFWYQTKGKVQAANDQIAELQTQKANVESQVEDLTNAKTSILGKANEFERQLADANSKISFTSNELSKYKRDIGRTEKDKEELQAKYDSLNQDFDQLKSDVANIKTVDAGAKVDPALLAEKEEQVTQLQTQLSDLKDKLAVAVLRTQGAASGEVGVNGSSATGGPVTLKAVKEQDASILRTDPDKGIVIISRGQVDGLQRQMEFNVAKGLERKVRVKVGTVAPTYSVAYILPGQEASRLQEGDSVKITQ